MGLKVYGILSAQSPDRVGETILLEGIDTSRLVGLRDEHENDNFFHKLGAITAHKKLFSDKDCETPTQQRCWEYAKVPLLYIEAELADDTEHPNAKSAAELIKFSQRPDIPLEIGFSIDGGIYERQTPAGQKTEDKSIGKIISKSQALDAAITVKPCHPKAKMWVMNDLLKSDLKMAPPARYFEALKKSYATSSIVDSKEARAWMLVHKAEQLRKSIKDYASAWTELKCYNCGKATRIFKSGDMPNSCKCGSSYSLSEMWKALNK